jgi:hypothetical protein
MFGQVRILIAVAAIAGACESSPRDSAPSALGRAIAPPPSDDGDDAGKDSYRVEVSEVAPPCTAGAVCAIRLRLVALGPYKLNAEYPMKFVAVPSAGVVHETSGPFQTIDPRTGVLDVRFRAGATGSVRIAGTYKTAICTDEVCHINDVAIAQDVTVVAAAR